MQRDYLNGLLLLAAALPFGLFLGQASAQLEGTGAITCYRTDTERCCGQCHVAPTGEMVCVERFHCKPIERPPVSKCGKEPDWFAPVECSFCDDERLQWVPGSPNRWTGVCEPIVTVDDDNGDGVGHEELGDFVCGAPPPVFMTHEQCMECDVEKASWIIGTTNYLTGACEPNHLGTYGFETPEPTPYIDPAMDIVNSDAFLEAEYAYAPDAYEPGEAGDTMDDPAVFYDASGFADGL